jgi:hypothetical protein
MSRQMMVSFSRTLLHGVRHKTNILSFLLLAYSTNLNTNILKNTTNVNEVDLQRKITSVCSRK